MTSKTLIQPAEIIHLSGISWQTYKSLLTELSASRRLRLTYNRGNLEIMVPSPEHERYKRVLCRFVETLSEELEVSVDPLGSTTFQLPELSGAEPDECFYIKHVSIIKGKKRIDLEQDPPPDLVVEVDMTSSSKNRFEIYTDMGVPEIWLYNCKTFSIHILQNKKYISVNESLAFPNLPLLEIINFLAQVEQKDYLDLVREFRKWVKIQIQQRQ